MKKIIVGFPHEDEHKKVAVEIFGGYLKTDFEDFFSSLDDDHKEILLRSAHFLKFYVHDLYNLPEEKEHLRDIYGFIGLTALVEFCALNDPKFKKTQKEETFKNYLLEGLTRDELDDLVDKIEIYRESANLSKKERFIARLKLIYEFRSAFVHHLHLPPVKRRGTLFLAHFHESGLVHRLLSPKDRKELRGLFLTIKLSLSDYTHLVERCILRNLGYNKV